MEGFCSSFPLTRSLSSTSLFSLYPTQTICCTFMFRFDLEDGVIPSSPSASLGKRYHDFPILDRRYKCQKNPPHDGQPSFSLTSVHCCPEEALRSSHYLQKKKSRAMALITQGLGRAERGEVDSCYLLRRRSTSTGPPSAKEKFAGDGARNSRIRTCRTWRSDKSRDCGHEKNHDPHASMPFNLRQYPCCLTGLLT